MNKRFFITAAVISLIILVVVLILSPRATKNTPIPPTTTTSKTNLFFSNLSEEKRLNASKYRTQISDNLPIYLTGYHTSVDIDTTINITLDPDNSTITQLDISGLSYLNKDELNPKKNPNLQAFQETFTKSLQLLRENNIDPTQLIFDYGYADYVDVTATYWVDKLGLLR